MRRTFTLTNVFLAIVFNGAAWLPLAAQTPFQVHTVSPLVGAVIDPVEYYRFGFHRYFPADKSSLVSAGCVFDSVNEVYWLIQRFESGDSLARLLNVQEFA